MSSSTLRNRKKGKPKTKLTDSTHCPPLAVRSVGFEFWKICTTRNLLCLTLILMAILYTLKVKQPITKQSQVDQQMKKPNLSQMIDKREVLPLNSALTAAFYHRKIKTFSTTAQQYFDQAMILSSAFNHDEAIRSLKYALMHDSKCAMCHWAIAYNYGMNINRGYDEDRLSLSIKHTQHANILSAEIHQDAITNGLIEAMILRFPKDRTIKDEASTYLKAYKDSLKNLTDVHPKDSDLWTLYAEALMDTMPWNYYKRKENANGFMENIPKADTLDVYDALERAFVINPHHLLALHLYIHIYEPDMNAIATNKNIEIIADRLRNLLEANLEHIELCGIGHLVHMPSHIYSRIGRFEDANIVNVNAMNIASAYYDYYNISDIYPNYNQFHRILYYCHRITFVIYSSMMNGQFKQAKTYSEKLFDECEYSLKFKSFFFENASWRDKVLIKFGKFKELIENYEKNDEWKDKNEVGGDNLCVPTMNAYARAFSYVSLKECAKGWSVYEKEFFIGYKNETIRSVMVSAQIFSDLLEVARHSFLGRYYDVCKDDMDKSAEHWMDAASQYDKLEYIEPPFWPISNRACLGQLYLSRGEYQKAISAFEDDLNEIPSNGWSLKGMLLALKALNNNNNEEIEKYKHQFKDAWKYADVEIDTACY